MSRLAVDFKRPTLADAEALACTLRQADLDELAAAGVSPSDALRTGVERSTLAAAVWDDEGLVALLGVAPLVESVLAPVGAPWMLGTDRVSKHARALVAVGPAYTRAMLDAYPRLMNVVHAKNTLHVRWLRRLGFRFRPHAIAAPKTGEPFLIFEMGV
jgi:hypothetical protein